MKTVMVIAGGNWQVPIIKKLKEEGHTVVVSNLYPDSIGFEYADYAEVADVRDKNRNLEIALKYDVDVIVTDQSDIAVPTVAYVSERMGRPTIGLKMAELFTNKYMMRRFCEKNGFAYPAYKRVTSVESALEVYTAWNKTAIIKPLDSQSSRGVFVINTALDIINNFEETQSFSADKESVLIEQYINGTEFTVDGIVCNGRHYTLAISEKEHFDYNESIASSLFFSYANERYDYDKLRFVNNKLIEKTELPFGLTHAEYKYSNGEFYLIEVAARGGGTRISSDIVPAVSGIDNYKIWIDEILGKNNISVDRAIIEANKEKCAILKFLDIKENGKKITEIRGIDEIKKLSGVIDFQVEFQVGDVIHNAKDDRSRVGFYIAEAENKAALEILVKQIERLFVIEYEV